VKVEGIECGKYLVRFLTVKDPAWIEKASVSKVVHQEEMAARMWNVERTILGELVYGGFKLFCLVEENEREVNKVEGCAESTEIGHHEGNADVEERRQCQV